jgi:hypothetical protein
VVAALSVAVAVGCGASATLDGAKLESKITTDLQAAHLQPKAASCPHDQAAHAGDQFTCSVTLADGSTLTYTVTETSDQGDYRYDLASGQTLDGAQVARAVTADLDGSGTPFADAKVTCPPQVAVAGGRATVTCSVSGSAGDAKVAVTVTPDGPLTWGFTA